MKKSFRHRRFRKTTGQNVHYNSKIQRHGQTKKDASDFARVVKRLRDACYQGCVALEYEAALIGSI